MRREGGQRAVAAVAQNVATALLGIVRCVCVSLSVCVFVTVCVGWCVWAGVYVCMCVSLCMCVYVYVFWGCVRVCACLTCVALCTDLTPTSPNPHTHKNSALPSCTSSTETEAWVLRMRDGLFGLLGSPVPRVRYVNVGREGWMALLFWGERENGGKCACEMRGE